MVDTEKSGLAETVLQRIENRRLIGGRTMVHYYCKRLSLICLRHRRHHSGSVKNTQYIYIVCSATTLSEPQAETFTHSRN